MTSTRPLRCIRPKSLGSALFTLSALWLALSGCATPMAGAEKDVKPADLEALKTVGAKAAGIVVWTSSRAGMPHLFTMKTDGSEITQITRGDTTDWHPRFSPDGRKILFSRSQDDGFVRESDGSLAGTWDLYTVNVDGTEISKVVEDATWGSWAGPDEITFLRGSKIMRTKLGSDDETKIVDTAHYELFAGATIKQPELSHDGHYIALTLGGNRRQTGIWNIRKKTWTQMGSGSQIAWAPDGASVYWVEDAGKEGSRIEREPVVAGVPADDRDPDERLLVDLGGKRSREGFPRLSNDGKWLVFGAAINDLENDLEDFELYLWEVGTSATAATRLTFHSANDRWPDIFVGPPGQAPAPDAEPAPAKDETDKPAPPEPEGDKPAPAEPDTKPAPAEDAEENAPPVPAPTKPKKKKHH